MRKWPSGTPHKNVWDEWEIRLGKGLLNKKDAGMHRQKRIAVALTTQQKGVKVLIGEKSGNKKPPVQKERRLVVLILLIALVDRGN